MFVDHQPGQAATCGQCGHRYTTAAPLCPSMVLTRSLLRTRRREDPGAFMTIADAYRAADTRTLPPPTPSADDAGKSAGHDLFTVLPARHAEPRRDGRTRPLTDAYGRAAAEYMERGWPVFLTGRSKRPLGNCPACRKAGRDHDPAVCDHLLCHGFHAATVDMERFRRMFTMAPWGLLAIRTGLASGLLVADIDPRNGGEIDRDLMAPTMTQATGGGGWHLLYRHPSDTPVLSKPMPDRPGVDIKGNGGFIVAAPSVHPVTGRPYRFVGGRPIVEVPGALLDIVKAVPAVTAAASTSSVQTRSAPGISSPERLLDALLNRLRNADPGTVHNTLYGVCRGVGRMVSVGAISRAAGAQAIVETGLSMGRVPAEIDRAVRDGFRDEGVAA